MTDMLERSVCLHQVLVPISECLMVEKTAQERNRIRKACLRKALDSLMVDRSMVTL